MTPFSSSIPMLSSMGWYAVYSVLPEKNLNSVSKALKGFLQLNFSLSDSKTKFFKYRISPMAKLVG